METALVVPPDGGRFLDVGNFEVKVLAAGEDTSGSYTLLQTQSEPPGFGPPLHVHRDAAEAFYVLEGEYLIFVEERQQRCSPGTFVYVPAGMEHTFRVVSAGPGKKLNLFTPAAMLGFFEDLADAEAAGTPTPEQLVEIAARHSCDMTGPVPESYL